MLTKKKTVEEHRKMWNWIGNEIMRSHMTKNIDELKKMYLTIYDKPLISFNCYCCEYTLDVDTNSCIDSCPLIWPGDKMSCCYGGLYSQICNEQNWQKQAELAYQIADLPEREDKIFDILEEDK